MIEKKQTFVWREYFQWNENKSHYTKVGQQTTEFEFPMLILGKAQFI